jgi:citrate lyase beta subunit
MRRGKRAVERWLGEAWPVVRSLMEAEDRLLVVSEAPSVVVLASCDQLAAAVTHAQTWLRTRRCPDDNFGTNLEELISACRGLCAIMQMVTREAPEGQWTGHRDLTD